MKTFIRLSTLLVLLSILACQSTDPAHIKEEELAAKLMAVHDEVMPKMGEINSLRKKLLQLKESETMSEDDKAVISESISYLEQSDDAMMEWMGTYKQPSKLRKEKSHEEILVYLKNEKVKIEQVKYDILSSISAAQALLKQNEK